MEKNIDVGDVIFAAIFSLTFVMCIILFVLTQRLDLIPFMFLLGFFCTIYLVILLKSALCKHKAAQSKSIRS